MHPQVKKESTNLEELRKQLNEALVKGGDESFDLRRELARATKMPLEQMPAGTEDVMSPLQKLSVKLFWAKNEYGKKHPKTVELKKQIQEMVEEQQALVTKVFSFKPTFSSAVIEIPEDLKKIQVRRLNKENDGVGGYLATNYQGKKLRRHIDSNGDNKLDVWVYFNGGTEVYRDVDKDFDGKVDEVIFMDGDLVRVGTDANQDGKIDSWNERALPSHLDRWNRK
jgi:regulator of replication initiation timing